MVVTVNKSSWVESNQFGDSAFKNPKTFRVPKDMIYLVSSIQYVQHGGHFFSKNLCVILIGAIPSSFLVSQEDAFSGIKLRR